MSLARTSAVPRARRTGHTVSTAETQLCNVATAESTRAHQIHRAEGPVRIRSSREAPKLHLNLFTKSHSPLKSHSGCVKVLTSPVPMFLVWSQQRTVSLIRLYPLFAHTTRIIWRACVHHGLGHCTLSGVGIGSESFAAIKGLGRRLRLNA